MAREEKNTGKLVKLRIKSYKDPEFSEDTGKEFTVMYNPREYSINYKIENNAAQGIGTSASAPDFKKIKPEKLSLDFVIDGTGVTTGEKVDVRKKVQNFIEVAYKYQGDEHRPRYLRVLWGTLTFNCVLNSSSVKYTLFDNDGKPLRAKINATFEGFTEDQRRVAEEDDNSPDLTHYRKVNDGDTLPLLCHQIYGNSKYYQQVARVNDLNNFRELESGRTLYFPPLKG